MKELNITVISVNTKVQDMVMLWHTNLLFMKELNTTVINENSGVRRIGQMTWAGGITVTIKTMMTAILIMVSSTLIGLMLTTRTSEMIRAKSTHYLFKGGMRWYNLS